MFYVLTDGCKPTRGSKYSACVDLYASEDVVIGAGETKLVGLGVCIDMDWMIDSADTFYSNEGMLPKYKLDHFLKTHYLQLMLRSSISKHLVIGNGVGVIDLDYEDEIKIRLHNPIKANGYIVAKESGLEFNFSDLYIIKKGDRIAQITLLEHKSYLFGIDTEDERTGGFGSTN